MAGDVLSQAELETLLNTMESRIAPAAGGTDPTGFAFKRDVSAEPSRKLPNGTSLYDFKRPAPASNEQLRTLQMVHEGLGRGFGLALSTQLRSPVDVKLVSVDQQIYNEFVLSLENPTCFNLLRARPWDGHLILDIHPSILYPMIDRMLGGSGEPAVVARRPLTEIELRLVSRITGLFLQELYRAWRPLLELELSVERVASNPHLAQVAPPGGVVMVSRFELGLNGVRGTISLSIPCQALQQISGIQSGNGLLDGSRRRSSDEPVKQVSESLRQSVVELVAQLAETRITTGDLFNLRVGDIITTQKDVHSPIAVCLEGLPKFRAAAGAFRGHKAIQLEESLGPPPEGTWP